MTLRPEPTTTAARLLPYVPRLAIEWLAGDPSEIARSIPGSMLFVDISGFTKMSERLARRGKIGAEEVTEVMNATFGRLLGIAYEHGGGLLKFGGDALLLFFRGDGHESRAARAAFEMRRALREHGRIATSAGVVTLRMSSGVHSGDFHFFLVGRTHRELVVAGPAASRTVEMEQTASAGEILLSQATAAALPARCLGAAKGEGTLLRSAPDTQPAPGFGPPPEIDLAICVPVAMREHLLAGVAEPEHRQATIAFIHFDGTDAMIERDGLEAVGEALDELTTVTQGAAAEHGVTFLYADIDHDGGKIILVAGAPQALGGDEERMLRAVRAIADAGTDLPVRIGVHRGPIFAADVGASYRRTYTVMGDAVNLAARVMSRARPGEILATPDVVERSAAHFREDPVEPFTVKGKSQPVRASSIGEIAGTRARPARRLPFIGRERELAVVGEVLDRVRAGAAEIVDLVGEAGIGKSRLVERMREMASGFRIVQTVSEPYAVSTPYFTFRGLLRELLGVESSPDAAEMTRRLTERIEPVAPELVPYIPLIAVPLDVDVRATQESDEIDARFRKQRIHRTVADLLAALLPGPSLVVFEDAYWMDDASRELFADVVARGTSSPWVLVLTRRPMSSGVELTEAARVTTLKLEPLAGDDATALAARAAGDTALPPQRLALLAERAGGNPLFLQELVAAVTAGATVESLPESVEAIVTARIDTLPPRDRTLLRYASVAGMTFSHELIAEVLEGEIDVSPLDWQRLADFVEPEDGRYRFLHALFRDVAYEGLPFRRRRLLHRRAGEVFERRHGEDAARYAELLSLHFHRAQLFDKAWRYSRLAGDGARDKYANLEAAEFYRRALDAARKLDDVAASDVASVAQSLGTVCQTAGFYDEAKAAFEQARKLTRAGGVDRPDLLMSEGQLRELTGRYSDALRWYARGSAALSHPQTPRGVDAELALSAAGVRLRQGRFAECVRLCEQVERSGAEPSQLAHAYNLLYLAHSSTGSPERVRYRRLALEMYEDMGDLFGLANACINAGVEAYYEGRWDDADALYGRAQLLASKTGALTQEIQVRNNRAEIVSDRGRWDEARAMFAEVVVIARSCGYRLGVVLPESNAARALARSGDPVAARADLERCLAEFEAMNADALVADSQARLAECAMLAGDAAEALRLAEVALHASKRNPTLAATANRVAGYALLQTGDVAGARAAIERSLAAARAAGNAFEEALTLEALARVAQRDGLDDTIARENDARALLERLGVVATPRVPLPG